MSIFAVTGSLNGQSFLGTGTFTVAPRFGFNYDVDGGLPAVATDLGCAPITAAKVFNSSMPSGYPGHLIPATVTHPLATIKIKLTATAPYISSADQLGLATVFSSMPATGVPMVTIDQEGEAGRFGYSANQVTGAHLTAYSIFQQHAPANAIYCQDFQTYSAHSRPAFASYVTPGLPLYLMDLYPTLPTTDAAESAQPCYDLIRSVVPIAPVGIAECDYTTSLTGGVTWTGGTRAQWFADSWAWALAHDMEQFWVYALSAHGVPWPADADSVAVLSAIAHESGL